MTLQQEAYKRIDQLSDDGIKALIALLDNITVVPQYDFEIKEKEVTGESDSFADRPLVAFPEEDSETKALRAEKKRNFMASAGKMDIDEEAIKEFRERSLV